jgi:acyl carrier protein
MLAAYFVADGEAPAIDELREFLRNALPAYMVPAFFVEMGEMPLTPNAKVDRRALPAPSRKSADGDRVQAPRTDVEEKIGAIWKQLLNIDHVGLDDNFFDVGGHSLQIVRLRSEMRKAFNREFSVLDLFSHPTVRSLATFLNSSNGPRETLSMASIHDINHRANLRREFFNRIQQEVERRVEA